MADPWRWWNAATLARITGCPRTAIEVNLPLIADALERRGVYERVVCLGVLPTVAIETASTFEPIDEYPDHRRYPSTGGYPPHYDGGPAYHGRGYLQLTHRSGYRQASAAVGVDLVADPPLANDPKIAAEILAWWFATKGVPAKDGTRFYTLVDLCREHDWYWVRVAVQGGTAGLDRLVAIASALDAYKEPAMPARVTFNLREPAHIQEHDHDCSQDSLEWAMWALGRKPQENWMEPTMVAEGVMSRELGLLDASGAGLAAFVRRHYAEYGFDANHEPSVTFDALAAEIGPYPMLIGGRAWNHWSGLWGYAQGQDVLLLANPSPGWKGVGQTMNRQQFAALGPFSMVRVLHPDLMEAAPTPAPPAQPGVRAELDEVISRLTTIRDKVTA